MRYVWLATTWLLWFVIATSTVHNVRAAAAFASDPSKGHALFMAILSVVSVAFGFFAYRLSRRGSRGPQPKVSKPILRYLGNFLLAMMLAWFLHVFGMVYAMFGVPLTAVLVIFFVPAWVLFLLNVPTRGKLDAWVNAGVEPK